jgi:phage FluMu gp28-like protein
LKEEDAANLVFNSEWAASRISFMESNLPEQLRSDCASAYGKLFFRDTGSRIWGIPEGGDQIRSYTASLIVSDEAAFQPEFEQAWKAANPSIKGGGKMIVVSSARSGAYMKRLIARV